MVDVSLKAISKLYYMGKYTGSEKLLYPIAFTDYVETFAGKWNLPPVLVLAVIREESGFNRYAKSRAGARGLMQLMPSTALWIAEYAGLKIEEEEKLYDPEVSINLGSFYLSRLEKKDSGAIVSVLASYNAGRGRMKKWIKRYRPLNNSMCAVETIGPVETRNFVRRVVGSLFSYVRQYGLCKDCI